MQPLPSGLAMEESGQLPDSLYAKDAAALMSSFKSQTYRSFCGPASLATVMRAYGDAKADQRQVFPSIGAKVKAFYSGVSLAELSSLATSAGLKNEVVYANTLSVDEFRDRVKANLANEGDFTLVNYDRRVLGEQGSGHISPIAAYDSRRDAFLVLDEAGYKYPFTWVSAKQLFAAAHTKDGERYRGLLFTTQYVNKHK